MIDERAVIDATARIAEGVTIGPYSVIGPDVTIDEGTWIGPHVVIHGPTKIGKHNQIFQFASVGEIPQDKKYHGEEVWLEIGDHNVIREFCTLNRGTGNGGGITKIGHHNLFMSYVHVAHDCIIGDHNILANYVGLAGHVILEDWVTLSGYVGVAQFCKIGAHSFACANAVVIKDVLPFTLVAGSFAKPYGLNTVGLKRRDFSEEAIALIQRAYKVIYRQDLKTEDAIQHLTTDAEFAGNTYIKAMVKAMKESQQGFVR